jgi:hypothetical protein
MNRVEIRRIQLPADAKAFVHAWWNIYEGDPHWVPPLVFERLQFFDPARNPWFKHGEAQLFIALRDGKAVGTISAHVDRNAQVEHPGLGYFGFFEFIDDVCIAKCLFESAIAWLKTKGVNHVQGPFNFSPNHEFGLLIDGFVDPPVLNPYNRPYYQAIYEQLGLTKAMDWYAYWLDKGPIPETIAKIADRTLSRNADITLRPLDLKNFDQEVRWFLEIYNDAWEKNWGHVHIGEAEFLEMAKGLKEFIDPRLVWWAFKGDQPIAAAITLPDVNQVVKKMNGGLFPFGWYHWLFGRGKIDALRVFVLGVKRDYQHLPIGACLYVKTWEEGMKMNIRGADASLILENNHRMRGALEKMGGRIYMTYRTYETELAERLDTDVVDRPCAVGQATNSPASDHA